MESIRLGNTSIRVSPLCFGSLTMTPFQANLTIKEGAYLLNYAFDKGINFIDTAEIYHNYPYINEALKYINRNDYIIASKTYAYTKEMARDSLDLALKEIGTDFIDIFLLHEQESIHTIKGHYDAIEYFMKAKDMGKIRAFGISTHRVAGVEAAKEFDEIEIIHPLVNKAGLGIQDASISDMIEVIKECHTMGKGIYSMKPLGGGHLIGKFQESLEFVRDLACIDSIAIGMQSIDEIDANIGIIQGKSLDSKLMGSLKNKERKLIVADYCIGCGNCETRCQQSGIEVKNGIAIPNDKCILCGYCATVCPEFCIKVV